MTIGKINVKSELFIYILDLGHVDPVQKPLSTWIRELTFSEEEASNGDLHIFL